MLEYFDALVGDGAMAGTDGGAAEHNTEFIGRRSGLSTNNRGIMLLNIMLSVPVAAVDDPILLGQRMQPEPKP